MWVFDNPNKVKTNSEPSRRSPRIQRVSNQIPAKADKIVKSTGKPKKKTKKKSKKTLHKEWDSEPLPVIDRVDDVKVSYSESEFRTTQRTVIFRMIESFSNSYFLLWHFLMLFLDKAWT